MKNKLLINFVKVLAPTAVGALGTALSLYNPEVFSALCGA